MLLKSSKPKKVVKGWRAVYEGKPVTYNPCFAGLPFEDETENALAKCVEVLGPIGKYEVSNGTDKVGKYVHVNTVLATEKHGKLWYGDLTADDVEYRLEALRVKLGVDQLLAYDYEDEVAPIRVQG